jgi:hypothetical protein
MYDLISDPLISTMRVPESVGRNSFFLLWEVFSGSGGAQYSTGSVFLPDPETPKIFLGIPVFGLAQGPLRTPIMTVNLKKVGPAKAPFLASSSPLVHHTRR